jgi:hypothetical protein
VNSLKIGLFVLLALMVNVGLCCAIEPIPVDRGPIHEAFVTNVTGSITLDSILSEPPPLVKEKIPPQSDSSTIWIPGYWLWSTDINDFIWMSGVWRRPPPGRNWIKGYWKQFDEGWVRMRGFWSTLPENSLTYIDQIPPGSLDEEVQNPPNTDFFWMPGYWTFLQSKKDYSWVGGQWQKLDPNWIFVPSYYVWRPGGYIFVLGYWDLPLEARGQAYAAVRFVSQFSPTYEYVPSYSIEPQEIIDTLFVEYPNYLYLYNHHYHFHHDYWSSCGCTPPWWEWNSWWSYPWHDQWSLAWWYTHPGYPQPVWLSARYSSMMVPPASKLLYLFKNAKTPHIVTPRGVISSDSLIKAISDTEGRKGKDFIPILPSNLRSLEKIVQMAQPRVPQVILKPSGKDVQINQNKEEQITKPISNPEKLKELEAKKINPPDDQLEKMRKPSGETPRVDQRHPSEKPIIKTAPQQGQPPLFQQRNQFIIPPPSPQRTPTDNFGRQMPPPWMQHQPMPHQWMQEQQMRQQWMQHQQLPPQQIQQLQQQRYEQFRERQEWLRQRNLEQQNAHPGS